MTSRTDNLVDSDTSEDSPIQAEGSSSNDASELPQETTHTREHLKLLDVLDQRLARLSLSSTTEKMPPVPEPRDLDKFKGASTDNAKRWLKTLHTRFDSMPGATDPVDPYNFLKIADTLLAGNAEIWADSTPQIRSILDKSEPGMPDAGKPTNRDREVFEEALKARFPGTLTDLPVVDATTALRHLAQSRDESLASYYSRASTLLQQLGCHDMALATTYPSPQEVLVVTMRKQLIEKFIQGLANTELRKESMVARCFTSGLLKTAYQIIEETQTYIAMQQKMAAEEQMAQKAEMWDSVKDLNIGRRASSYVATVTPSYRASQHQDAP